jgi:DNA-binding Lrp family transcriptional regulator
MSLLDATDFRILQMLQADANITTKEIAARLHITTTPVFERVKRLEREGYIASYVALLDRKKVGLTLVAYTNVSLKEHNSDILTRFEEAVRSLPEVMECYHIAGLFDYLLKVVVRDMDDYQHFVAKKLAALENIGKVQSSFVMTEIKHTTSLHLESGG